jgi:hypothetical protein
MSFSGVRNDRRRLYRLISEDRNFRETITSPGEIHLLFQQRVNPSWMGNIREPAGGEATARRG